MSYNFGSGSATIAPVSGTGSATIGTYYVADYPTPITLATLTTSVLGGPAGNFTFTTNPGLILQLTEAGSAASATFALNLSVNGTVNPDGTFSASLSGGSIGYATLGGHDYLIDLSSASATSSGADQGAVTFDAQVSVYSSSIAVGDPGSDPLSADGAGEPGGVLADAAPEPSTLLLTGAGLGLLAVGLIRKRRAAQSGCSCAL